MTSHAVTKRIRKHLKNLLDDPGVTLGYVSQQTGLSHEGVRKAATVTKRMGPKTAQKLAEFIEGMTRGGVRARDLVCERPKFLGSLKGADFSGEDLTGVSFLDKDVTGANFSGAHGVGVDFRCAKADGAIFGKCKMAKWDFTGASIKGALLQEVDVERSVFVGTDFSDATFEDVHWNTNGTRTRGIVLPKFDPAQISWANDCHDTVARLLQYEFEGDFEIRQITEFVLSRTFPCWDGFAERVLNHYPKRVEDLEIAFGKYPAWKLLERWKLACALYDCRILRDYEALRGLPYYTFFESLIEARIRKNRNEGVA